VVIQKLLEYVLGVNKTTAIRREQMAFLRSYALTITKVCGQLKPKRNPSISLNAFRRSDGCNPEEEMGIKNYSSSSSIVSNCRLFLLSLFGGAIRISCTSSLGRNLCASENAVVVLLSCRCLQKRKCNISQLKVPHRIIGTEREIHTVSSER
jgi:hypothetical protein